MNTFKRKALTSAVIAGLAGAKTVAWFLLGPVYDYYMDPRNGLVKFDSDSKELKELGDTFTKKFGEFSDALKKNQDKMDSALDEIKREGTVHAETAKKLKESGEAQAAAQKEMKEAQEKHTARLQEIEQKLAKKTTDPDDPKNFRSVGQRMIDSDQFKAMIAAKEGRMAPITVERKAILNATGQNQPLVPSARVPGVIMAPNRRLTIRDLLPQIPTETNLIEYAKENVFTNSAAPQGSGSSPVETEGQVKAESTITFTLTSVGVITLAHFIAASRQILADAKQLAGYIDARLEYGLKLEEEDELLNSTGTNGELNGLRNQADAFDGSTSNDTALDTLLRAFLQVSLSEYESTGVVLHPRNWINIMLIKDTQGRYIFSDPHSAETPRVWGKNVVPTQSMPVGNFLTGAFDLGAAIYDREGVSIRISDQHSDFFTRNLIAILCEERLALVVYRPSAFVKGAISSSVN